MPCFVSEVGISGNGINVHAQFLQFVVMIRYVAQFGRANEGEVSWIEEEHTPAAFGVFLGDFDEFAVFERLVFKRFNFGVNQGHLYFLRVFVES
ncbi:hypothetical protein D3C87_1581630 [compost metagenome]